VWSQRPKARSAADEELTSVDTFRIGTGAPVARRASPGSSAGISTAPLSGGPYVYGRAFCDTAVVCVEAGDGQPGAKGLPASCVG
jgi:hypothetical protein